MANLVDNTLFITLPKSNLEALIDALRGPEDWLVPAAANPSDAGKLPPLNAHLELAIYEKLSNPSEIISAFKRFMAPYGWPEALMPSRLDLIQFIVDKDMCLPTMVDFSVPRLSPWTEEDVARFLPNKTPEGPFWEPKDSHGGVRRHDLHRERMGIKWTPDDITFDAYGVSSEMSQVRFKYTTPWSQISDITGLLTNVLAQHDARMLHFWVEEQGFCGFTSFNPASPTETLEQSFHAKNQFQVPYIDPDYPDESFHRFSESDFEAFVFAQVNDPFFVIEA